MIDWTHIRAHKTSNERPHDWPADIRAISQEGLSLFGIRKVRVSYFGTASTSGRAAFFCSVGQSAGSLALQRPVLSARSLSTLRFVLEKLG
jgi:hypothetical protein